MSSQLSDAALSRLSPDQACRALAILAERVGVDVVRDAMFDAVAESAFPSDVVKSAVLAGGFGHSAPAPANGIDGGHHHSTEEAENAHQTTGIHEKDNENDYEMAGIVPKKAHDNKETFSHGPTNAAATADLSEGNRPLGPASGPLADQEMTVMMRSDGFYRTSRARKISAAENERNFSEIWITSMAGPHVAERQTGKSRNHDGGWHTNHVSSVEGRFVSGLQGHDGVCGTGPASYRSSIVSIVAVLAVLGPFL